MDQQGTTLSRNVYCSLLKACIKRKALVEVKQIHAHLAQRGLEFSRFLGEFVVSTLVKCGGLGDALQLFHRLPNKTALSWTAVISGYTAAAKGHEALRLYDYMQEEGVQLNKYTFAANNQHGQAEKALQTYEQMRHEGISPNTQTFVRVLQACGLLAEDEEEILLDGRPTKVRSLKQGKVIHVEGYRKGCHSDIFVGSTLISMYGKCGSIADAQNVFDGLPQTNVVTWTAMLAAYGQQGQPAKALQLYEKLWEEGVSPNARTLVSALQSCGMLAEKDISDDGSTQLHFLAIGKEIHAQVQRSGYHTDVFVCSTLISMYGKCGSIADVQMVFDGLSEDSVVLWNAMLVAYVQQGKADKALHLYKQMQERGRSPNARTIVTVLQACGTVADTEEFGIVGAQSTKLKSLKMVKVIHADAGRKYYTSNLFVYNTLVSMYGKCGSIQDAEILFYALSKCTVVSWTAMLTAYAEQEQGKTIFELYEQMLEEGVNPDDRVLVILLQACGMLAEKEEHVLVDGEATRVKSLEKGKAVHGEAFRKGYHCDTFVGNTLVIMYGKCGSISDASRVFAGLAHRDLVSWNAILAVYAQNGEGEKALQLYRQMQEEGISADEITFLCILHACSSTGSLDLCREVHQAVMSSGKILIPLLANALIHTYGRCANMADAKIVFDALSEPDVVSWTALIAGYAREGNWVASLQFYEKMRLAEVTPNEVTFLSLLLACSHAGLLDKAVEFFESMTRDHGITPKIEHFACMIDLAGRAGHLDRVEQLVASMPLQPDLSIWLSILSACRRHCTVSLGRRAFDNAVQLQPKDAAAYVLISNLYADAGLWELAQEMQDLRQKAGAWKKPGQSWIQSDEDVNNFLVGDRRHPQQEELRCLLEMLDRELGTQRVETQ